MAKPYMIKYLLPICVILPIITAFAGYYISPLVIPTMTVTQFTHTESTTIVAACARGQGIYFHAVTVTEEITIYKTTTLAIVRTGNITTTTTITK